MVWRISLSLTLVACLSACAGGADEHVERAAAALEAQDYAAARDHAAAALQADPRDPLALADLARAQLALGQGAEALATLERLRNTGRLPPDILLLRAEGELQTGRYDRTLALIGQPQTAEEWRLHALAQLQSGNVAAGIDAFSRGREAAGPRHRLNVAEGIYWLEQGDEARAAAALQRAATEAPEAIEVLFLSARLASAQNRGGDALAAYLAILDKAPLDRPALLGAIAQHAQRGEIEAMRPLVERGLRAMPGDAEFTYLRARLLAEKDDWGAVRELLQRREQFLRSHPESRALYAQALLELGQPELARAHAAPLYRAYPGNVTIRRIYARALIETDDAASARQVLRPLVERTGAEAIDRRLAARAAHS